MQMQRKKTKRSIPLQEESVKRVNEQSYSNELSENSRKEGAYWAGGVKKRVGEKNRAMI